MYSRKIRISVTFILVLLLLEVAEVSCRGGGRGGGGRGGKGRGRSHSGGGGVRGYNGNAYGTGLGDNYYSGSTNDFKDPDMTKFFVIIFTLIGVVVLIAILSFVAYNCGACKKPEIPDEESRPNASQPLVIQIPPVVQPTAPPTVDNTAASDRYGPQLHSGAYGCTSLNSQDNSLINSNGYHSPPPSYEDVLKHGTESYTDTKLQEDMAKTGPMHYTYKAPHEDAPKTYAVYNAGNASYDEVLNTCRTYNENNRV